MHFISLYGIIVVVVVVVVVVVFVVVVVVVVGSVQTSCLEFKS